MKIVLAILASMLISGSVLADRVPSTDSESSGRSTSRSREWNQSDETLSLGIRVYIGQLRGPMDRVLRAKVGAELEKAGYTVVDETPEYSDEENQEKAQCSENSGLLPTIGELIARDSQPREERASHSRKRVEVDSDFTISGYFDTDGLIRSSVQVERSAGVRVSLEGLMALKIGKGGSDRIHQQSIRESYSTWIGSVSVGGRRSNNGSFPTIWGGNSSEPAATVGFSSPSYLKAYEEVYTKIAVKVVKELDGFALPKR